MTYPLSSTADSIYHTPTRRILLGIVRRMSSWVACMAWNGIRSSVCLRCISATSRAERNDRLIRLDKFRACSSPVWEPLKCERQWTCKDSRKTTDTRLRTITMYYRVVTLVVLAGPLVNVIRVDIDRIIMTGIDHRLSVRLATSTANMRRTPRRYEHDHGRRGNSYMQGDSAGMDEGESHTSECAGDGAQCTMPCSILNSVFCPG